NIHEDARSPVHVLGLVMSRSSRSHPWCTTPASSHSFSAQAGHSVLGEAGQEIPQGRGGGFSLSGFVPSGTVAETGTIAGIASALAMALIGAVSSYISYQQKKFCFSIQQGLNAEYVKGENMEAVVTEEPQVKYSALETQSAEPPPPQDNAKV
uniref:CD99 antigen-like protein 2 n=1 Tax=Sphenodon punctatus TaxID=8508 RepID=A0A8D0H813_SPHPU